MSNDQYLEGNGRVRISTDPVRRQAVRAKTAYILLLSAFIQVLFLVAIPGAHRANESSDYVVFYSPVAQNLLEGKGLITPDGKVASDYPPGFPVYLATHYYLADRLGMDRGSLITATNILFTALSCLLVGWIAESVFAENIVLISALLWATYLFNLWLVKQPNSEVPFIFLFYLAIYFLFRGLNTPNVVWFAAVGLFLGVASLIRPIILFLPFVLTVLLLLYRDITLGRRFVRAGLLLLAFLVVVLPWELKLELETGHFVPLSTNGPASMLDGLTFAAKTGKGGNQAWAPVDVEVLARRIRENQHSLHTIGQVSGFMLFQVRSNPIPVIEMGALKAARSWYGTNAMWHEGSVVAIQAVYFVLIVSGIWLAWRRFPTKRPLSLLLLVIVAYFWVMTIAVLSILRYMVPAIGFLLIFGAVALDTMAVSWRSKGAYGKTSATQIRTTFPA